MFLRKRIIFQNKPNIACKLKSNTVCICRHEFWTDFLVRSIQDQISANVWIFRTSSPKGNDRSPEIKQVFLNSSQVSMRFFQLVKGSQHCGPWLDQILTSIKGCNSVANCKNMTLYNPNVDLVKDNVYANFG